MGNLKVVRSSRESRPLDWREMQVGDEVLVTGGGEDWTFVWCRIEKIEPGTSYQSERPEWASQAWLVLEPIDPPGSPVMGRNSWEVLELRRPATAQDPGPEAA